VSLWTVKPTPLLATPPTVTTTFPVVDPAGTGAAMLAALQLDGVAVTPLNLTVLVPCTAPKLAPLIVTDAPTTPDDGFRLVMLGAGVVPPPGVPPCTGLEQPVLSSTPLPNETSRVASASRRHEIFMALLSLLRATIRCPVRILRRMRAF